MNKKKTIAVAIVLALILLIGGMLAFYTDTDSKTNTFTLGEKVDIKLNEVWNEANGQKILPGTTVNKAPSVENLATETKAYVFLKVIVPTYAGTNGTTELFSYETKAGWVEINSDTNPAGTHVYAYATNGEMTELAGGSVTGTLFDTVTLDKNLTKAQADTLASTNIEIYAYGIQSSNLTKSDGTQASTPAEIFALFGNN